jgi:hypothetical protein
MALTGKSNKTAGAGQCRPCDGSGIWSFSGLVHPRSPPRPRFLKPVPDQMITIEVGFTITPCDLFGGASQRWGEEKRALVKSAMFNGTHGPVGAGS